jgi:hypothetical protein
MLHEVFGGALLGHASNLANQHDALGLGVGQEHLQAVDEVGAVERITTDANAQRLTQTNLKCKLTFELKFMFFFCNNNCNEQLDKGRFKT